MARSIYQSFQETVIRAQCPPSCQLVKLLIAVLCREQPPISSSTALHSMAEHCGDSRPAIMSDR